ncbi:alpha/beta fold hydrolase [Aquihabitans sp. G128]|uniref:lipase family alpha/beta hydrolase n=1 Tax=Aquihabitans sp. G128 TaxID=2849779 RepID=UPI001C221C3B|nr:alpha/beta fold hydrolase [Aquihabitans sp. G128]QXC63308.1 alpha/beta fold hydrolase [Aquihabitans sp. G128]
MPKWVVGLVAAVSATLLVGGGSASAAAPRTIPRPAFGAPTNLITGGLASALNPMRSPAGTNDYSCRPSAAHPNPVVLVHGTIGNAYDSWSGLGPVLKSYGYCVFAVNYGAPSWSIFKGTGDIPTSAAEIGRFVDGVRSATHAAKVDLVGHSQGGSVSRYYANLIGGSAKVGKVIGLAPSNHATTVSGIITLGRFIGVVDPLFALTSWAGLPALQQQTSAGSTFYRNLNGNGETRPGISYTNIATRYDEVVTPYTQAFIAAGSGATVKNTTLQDVCGADFTDHLGITYDTNVYQLVLNALDPADQRPVDCRLSLPLFGT